MSIDIHRIKWNLRQWFPWLVPMHQALFSLRTKGKSAETLFRDIYRRKWWGERETVSGLGSRVEANRSLIAALPGLFKRYDIKSVVDAPCGDFNWMRHVDLSSVAYTGVDIVPELIDANLAAFANERIKFCHLNVLTDQLPDSDLIICKDLMIHLSNEQILRLVSNIKNSGARMLLATTAVDTRRTNSDIPMGYYRKIDLTKAPFDFPAPLELIPSDKPAWNAPNGIWEIESLPSVCLSS